MIAVVDVDPPRPKNLAKFANEALRSGPPDDEESVSLVCVCNRDGGNDEDVAIAVRECGLGAG